MTKTFEPYLGFQNVKAIPRQMKRTLFAVGVAVLISLMVMPVGEPGLGFLVTSFSPADYAPFFLPPKYAHDKTVVIWPRFILQTTFLVVLAAVIVNIPWRRRPRK